MKINSTFLILALLMSCSRIKKEQVLIRQLAINSVSKGNLVTTMPNDSDIVLSDSFWNHFTSTFESASIELFKLSKLPFPDLLSDTTHDFAIITNENRIRLKRYLPINLNQTESYNYIEEQTMRLPTDDPLFKIDTLQRRWVKASELVEKEYLQFYKLLSDTTKNFIIIFNKSYSDKILTKLKHFG